MIVIDQRRPKDTDKLTYRYSTDAQGSDALSMSRWGGVIRWIVSDRSVLARIFDSGDSLATRHSTRSRPDTPGIASIKNVNKHITSLKLV
jgi:hypothetical protein